ncbi:PREDICTED: secretogranin-1 [Nanorana parkeri]|uniref:secretogranin-1 n=1 Tax=Nanorana parkeri TaxID=125878 RepID=UPI0008547C6A|nr:PREDICTED: secretogranin-1 [Nanorana parkeri]
MVTRCIVEVLSNALAKPNAPPIDPECKEILKKSSRHNQDEEEGELKQDETRTIKDPGTLEHHQHDSKEEARESPDLQKEYEEKRHHAETENREDEEEKVKETEQFDEKEESTGHSKERSFAEDDDKERGDHKDHYEKEDIEKINKYHDSQEHDIFGNRAYHTAKHTEAFPEEDNEEDAKNLEEIIKRHPLNINWKKLLQPEKFHSTHSSEVPEENDEWEEEKEKRSFKPNHEELRQRLFGYEEKRSHHEEPRNHLTEEKTSYSKGQRPHLGETSLENRMIKNYFDKRSHHDKESSEEVREKKHHHQGSEEEIEHHDSSEESNEKELTGQHYEEKRRHEERKRWPSQQNSRLNYEESNEDSEESNENIDKRHEHEQEKENLYKKLKHHLQESDEDEPFKQDKKQDEKRYYIGEEMVDGMKRYYPNLSQEKGLRQYEENKNHYREDSEESNLPDNDMYKQNYAKEERRSVDKHRLPNDPLKWQSRYFENADHSEEDRKRSLQVKNMFPDYGDYDLWGKRQLVEDVNHQYGGNRSPAKTHKFEEKREYDRMDELAQLLNYKKKSVEFPEFYDSEEVKKRHYDERGRFRERPLTEEEEKELENLAIMDLELQKIAEKLSNNRQG